MKNRKASDRLWRQWNPEKSRAKSKRYRERHPDRVKAKWDRYISSLRQRVFDHYGSVCRHCGETDIEELSIDHIEENGNEHRKELGMTGGGYPFYLWLIRNDYPKGYQVLCKTCNKLKSIWTKKLDRFYQTL